MKDPCQSKMVSWPRSGRLVALTVALAALSGVAGAVPAASDAKDGPVHAPPPPRPPRALTRPKKAESALVRAGRGHHGLHPQRRAKADRRASLRRPNGRSALRTGK